MKKTIDVLLLSGIAFSYNGANEFVRGPLGYSAHIVSVYYMVLLVIATFRVLLT